MKISKEKFYSDVLLIRLFEERVIQLFSEGYLAGTTHAYIGQEANAVGVINALNSNDIVISNHRCHGHYLAFKNNPYGLLCEMMGKEDGLCGGRGGSQHICDGNFFSNGIQGGILPLSAGLAFAEKWKKSDKIVTVFIGDGTLGQGVLYETLNIISKWKLPLLVVVENNLYAQSTKIDINLAGSIRKRFEAFGIKTEELSTFDCNEIYDLSYKIVKGIREQKIPSALVLNTYRFASHSKSDDGRDTKEIESWKAKDPLKICENKLEKNIIIPIKEKLSKYIDRTVDKAIKAKNANLLKGVDY